MNKKNKVLISAAGMLILTATAATASTFAWFTTVRNATINYSQAEVYSSSSDLSVAWSSSLLTTVAHTSADPQNISVTGVHRITDISGNGQNFYKPTWNSSDTSSEVADSISTLLTTGIGAADGYYVDFTLTLSQSAAATGNMNVYVGANTVITPHTADDPQDIAAVKCARLAILDETSTPVYIWTPDADDASYQYVTTADPGTALYTVDGFTTDTQTVAFDAADRFHAGTISNYTTTALATAANVYPIATLLGTDDVAPDPSDNITIRAWIEGTDPECENVTVGGGALGGVFDFSLDIYGIAA